MSLTHSAALPNNGRSLVAQHINDLVASSMPSAVRGKSAQQLQVTDGYPVYTVDLDDLLKSHLFAGAKVTSFRYLVLDNADAVAEAEVIQAGGGARVAALRETRAAEAVAKGITHAESATGGNSFEIRVIQAPAVHFAALWLHRRGADMIIPIEPDLTTLPHGKALTEAQALAVLVGRAKEVKAAETGYPGASGG
ncbi:MAG: hypothetical protein IPK82_28810 [Polyangiaceae bacterium]|nr:hypothetical protein [Polyangiaceae bacterium]